MVAVVAVLEEEPTPPVLLDRQAPLDPAKVGAPHLALLRPLPRVGQQPLRAHRALSEAASPSTRPLGTPGGSSTRTLTSS